MHRKCASLVGCLVTLFLLIGGVSRAEVVARCGQGYLETIDGYRRQIDGALQQLTDEELFRRPAEGINSVAIILRHLGGNLLSRWSDFLTTDGEKPNRRSLHRVSQTWVEIFVVTRNGNPACVR